MFRLEKVKRLSRLSLLSLLMVAACTQPGALNPPPDRPIANGPIASAPPDQWQPPPDPVFVDESVAPSSILPSKVGECADTTITSITDRFGADLTPSKKGSDKGTFIRFQQFRRPGFACERERHRSIPGL